MKKETEVLISSEDFDGGQEWRKLLSENDQKVLRSLEVLYFKNPPGKVVWAMGVESGQLLKSGPMVEEIRDRVAQNKIYELESNDRRLFTDELSRRSANGDFKWKWWSKKYFREHRPEYLSINGAILPPTDWKKRTKLSMQDIITDNLGVTIFVKIDAIAKKSKIFD